MAPRSITSHDGAPRQEAEPDQPRPKPGPGQHFRREMIDKIGPGKQTKRYKNINASPLIAAFERGQLRGPKDDDLAARERFDYALKFERWWLAMHGTGSSRDSTNPGIGGGQGRTFSEEHEHGKRQIRLVREKMASRNYLIVEALVGDGYSMIDSLRRAGVETNRDGTAFRVREALDDLVCVLTGRLPVPIVVP